MKAWWLLAAASLALLIALLVVIALMVLGYVAPGPAAGGAFVCAVGLVALTNAFRCEECRKSVFRRDLFKYGTALGEAASYMTFWPERCCSRCGEASFGLHGGRK